MKNFGSGARAFTGNFIVNFIRTTPPNPGDILISEFRFRGQMFTANDEFIEIVNNTNQGITVNVTDGSSGWLVRAADPTINFIIPNGTTIPARGHYLGGNASGYNLFSYGAADQFYSGDIPDSGGVAIFSTAATHLSIWLIVSTLLASPASRIRSIGKALDSSLLEPTTATIVLSKIDQRTCARHKQ